MSNTTLNTFPSNKYQALAFLWLERQDLSGKSPAELLAMYDEAYNEMNEAVKAQRDKNKSGFVTL